MTTFKIVYLLLLLAPGLAFGDSNPCNVLLSGQKNVYIAPEEKNSVLTSPKPVFKNLLTSIKDHDDLRWTYANLFYDRNMIATSALRETDDLSKLWDEPRFFFKDKSPLENFKTAYETFVLNNQELVSQPLSKELLQEFHKILMKGGVENTSSSAIGVIRIHPVYFRMRSSELNKTRSLFTANPFLRIGTSSQSITEIYYPTPEFVHRLLDDSIARHNRTVKNSTSLAERVRAHTDFVWEFISIHPFANGNGRTSRFILDYLLAQDGLSPSLLSDTKDIMVSKAKYYEKVILGIKTTDLMATDLAWRAQEGLDLKGSPYSLAGNLPQKVWFASEGTHGEKLPFPVDLYDYAQFVRDRTAAGKLSTNETECLREYVAWLKKWSIHFEDSKGELQLYQVKRVPNELIELWKNKTGTALKTKESINLFHQNFYETDQLHRGLSLRQTATDQELVDYFRTEKSIDLSMNAAQKNGSTDAIISDFKTFNALMNKPEKLFEYVRDHMNAEGLYSQSPFNSTAKVFSVADRFAKGFMMNESWIKNMKGQLTISMLRPKYGVMDLNRLREISAKNSIQETFKSKYPRQQEVSIVGSVHHASVMRIEFRDVNVLEAVENSGEYIAGDTEIKLKRVLTRLENDPTKVRLDKFDGKGVLISSSIISL